jgi:hypothetical protein
MAGATGSSIAAIRLSAGGHVHRLCPGCILLNYPGRRTQSLTVTLLGELSGNPAFRGHSEAPTPFFVSSTRTADPVAGWQSGFAAIESARAASVHPL